MVMMLLKICTKKLLVKNMGQDELQKERVLTRR